MSIASYVVISASFAALLGFPDAQTVEPGDNVKTLELIAQRTEQNQQSFASFFCRFRIALGLAPTIADALRDGPSISRFAAEGSSAVKGEASTFELIAPKDSLEKAIQLAATEGVVNEVTLPFADTKVIGNGRQQWSYTYHSAAGFGVIQQAKKGFVKYLSPFDTCLEQESQIGAPAKLIRHGLNGGCDVRLMPHEMTDKQNIHRVELVEDSVGEKRVKLVTQIKFDADRGYLPMEVSVGISGKPVGVKTIVVSAAKAANGAWYPQRSLKIQSPDTKSKTYNVEELFVTEMRLNVEDQDLHLTIPEGTAIQDDKSLGNASVLEKDTVVTPDTLDKIKSGTKSSTIKFLRATRSGAATQVPK